MTRWRLGLVLVLLLSPGVVMAQRYVGSDGKVNVALVKMPYRGARNVPELSASPDYLASGGIVAALEGMGCPSRPIQTVRLTDAEQDDYGVWHRLGLANRHLAEIVAGHQKENALSVGLLANCSSLMGMLAGLQRSGPSRRPLRVGLVFIDAHGDFNTPETTLSGMLGGMPVAVSAGLCLRRLRLESGLDPALPTRYVVMAGLRDADPLEQELIDRSDIEHLSVEDLETRPEAIRRQMKRLAEQTDRIYVHVDMDVLDPEEVPGHSLNVADGPTSHALAAALTEMFLFDEVAALGIASTPSGDDDPDGLSLRAAYNLIQGAVRGVQQR